MAIDNGALSRGRDIVMRCSLWTWFLAASICLPASALAQGKKKAQPEGEEPEMTFEEDEAAKPAQPEPEPEPEPAGEPQPEPGDDTGALDLGADPTADPSEKKALAGERVSWQDIVVVV